jgi:hypothetical protein
MEILLIMRSEGLQDSRLWNQELNSHITEVVITALYCDGTVIAEQV